MTSIRVIELTRNDEGRVAGTLVERPMPAPGPDQALVRVQYSSLNFKDALAITGKGKIARKYPLIAGIDLAGTVVESSRDGMSPGDVVLVTGCMLSETRDGGLADYVVADNDILVQMPRGLTARQAMQLGTAGFTAGLAMFRMLHNYQTPDLGPILVTGATGGVGSWAVNLLSRKGFEVHAASRKPEAAEYLTELGATTIVDPGKLDIGGRPLESERYGGVIDNVGGDLLSSLTTVVAEHGNVAVIGLAGGPSLNMTVMPMILRGVNLLGIHSVNCPMNHRLAVWDHLGGDWRPDGFDHIGRHEIPLELVNDACAEIMAGKVTGRYLVKLHD